MTYQIIDQTKETHGFMKDASRPFILIELIPSKNGMRKSTVNRYATMAQARRRMRDLQKGN